MTEQPLVPVRKAHAGSDSLGHVWPEDGAVVRLPYAEALVLVAIPDGGFSIVEPGDEPAPAPAPAPGPDPDVAEPAPKGKNEVTEPAPRGRRGRPPVSE